MVEGKGGGKEEEAIDKAVIQLRSVADKMQTFRLEKLSPKNGRRRERRVRSVLAMIQSSFIDQPSNIKISLPSDIKQYKARKHNGIHFSPPSSPSPSYGPLLLLLPLPMALHFSPPSSPYVYSIVEWTTTLTIRGKK